MQLISEVYVVKNYLKSNPFFCFSELDEKGTLLFEIIGTLNPEEVEVGTLLNLAEMTSHDLTKIFRPTDNGPCEGVKAKIRRTLRVAHMIVTK